MVLARAGELLLIGLSTENVRRLEAGHPISIDAASHPGVLLGDHGPVERIGILLGDTERHIVELLQRVGAVGDDTRVIAMPRSGQHGSEPS